MFDLLTPIFATAGVIAATVPFVLHMLRRTPSQKMPFSLVKFLKPSLPKMTKRSTIEHWPLMLLRILALILIGLAFGRPFQRLAVEGEIDETSAVRVAVLLDGSASMRRDELREQAIEQLKSVVADLGELDALSVSVFSRTSRTLVSASEWAQTEPGGRAALIEKVIEEYEPDWFATNTGSALLNAADDVSQEVIGGPKIGERRVVLITDFQRGSRLDELQATTWPASVDVDLRVVRPKSPGNAGITLLPEDRDGQPRVRITNSADAVLTDYGLQPFDRQGNPVGRPIKASVAAGQRRSVVIPVSDDKATAVIAGVELLQDVHPFDNVVDLPLVENPLLGVMHVGPSDSNNAAEMKYYLQRAIDGNETEPFELTDTAGADGVVLPIGEDVRLVVVTGVVAEGLLPSMQACLDRGGSILVAIKSPEVAASVSSLLPEPLQATEAVVKDYAMLGQIDFGSQLFAAFSDARFSDFSTIRFWHHRDLQMADVDSVYRTVAKFDTGAPAILETTTDAGGRIILLAAGWHPDDSQWALSTRFPPMITSLVRQSYPRSTGQLVFSAGDVIVPEELVRGNDWLLEMPNHSSITNESLKQSAAEIMQEIADAGGLTSTRSDADSTESKASVVLQTPGRYVLSATGGHTSGPTGQSINDQLTLIVGVPVAETRTDTLPLGQLQALGVQADAMDTLVADSRPLDPVAASQLTSGELESRQKLWRWLLLAGLGCLMLETLIAGGIERRQRLESAA